ncbi:protein tramtrack, beta isoform isoform X2 [Anabrus simplex]|uniref:protein tramtrack, beta isoform isoform X2 n=1 Tax=Anabrus simplex TaxID=316456 RepID=UPI0035A26FAA
MTSTLSTQRFCLRWNNHQSNLLSVFDQLLHDESFVDVTLAVEGRLLRAHKMVLSACSPYFQALFIGHPDKHPIVILKDVPFCDMRSLLEFMYRGEVSVDQDRLTAFLKVAESLRIKGLTEVNEEKCDLPSITSSLLSNVPNVPLVTTHTPSPPNLHRFTPGPASHKRAAPPLPPHSRSNPLLGSALTAPKRKRGRPRKLSGSSGNDSLPNLLPVTTVSQNPATTNGGNGENTSGSRSQTQTPSNMLDDNHSELETENRSGGMNAAEGQRSGGMNGAEVQRSGGINGAEGQRSGGINAAEGLKSEGMEVAEGQGQDQSDGPDYKRSVASGDRQPEGENGAGSTNIPSPNQLSTPLKDLIAKQIKQEPEPTPGPSSQDPGQAYLRPSSTQETDNYALDQLEKSEDDGLMDGDDESSLPDDENELITLSPTSSVEEDEMDEDYGNGDDALSVKLEKEVSENGEEHHGESRRRSLGDLTVRNSNNTLSIMDAKMLFQFENYSDFVTEEFDSSVLGNLSSGAMGGDEDGEGGMGSTRRFCVREAENVYRCKVCHKTYTHISNFCRHYLTTHKQTKQFFSCPMCSKEFTRRDNMMTHLKGVHRLP